MRPVASSTPRDCSSSRSAGESPLAVVGTAFPFASTVSSGRSMSACRSASLACSGPLPAATYSTSGLATQLWR